MAREENGPAGILHAAYDLARVDLHVPERNDVFGESHG
jgi:hypothetical protein